ncbi:4Fe-4S dicluster domain-containing protein [Candidatus Poribacteria bacterium]
MNIKSKTLKRGYRFKNFAGQPADKLVELGIPEKVLIPLAQGAGEEVPSNVSPGDTVKAGQIIGINDDSVSNPVHSTVNGVVENIAEMQHLGREIRGVEIRSDGTSDWQPLLSHSEEWEKLSNEDLEKTLYLSGAASLDGAGIPTKHRSSTILPDDVQHIIVREVGSEIYSPSLNVLLGEDRASHFVEGLKILNKIMPGAKVHLALSNRQKQVISKISSLTSGLSWLDMFTLTPKYPQEFDEVIIPTVLDRPFSFGSSAADMGVVILSVQTVLHVYEAVVEGKAVIERVVALGGTGFKENCHVRLRVGAPLEHLTLDRTDVNKPARFVLNSPMTGATLSEQSPLDRQCATIIALPEETTRQFLNFVNPGFRRDSYSRTFLASLPGLTKDCDTNAHGDRRPCVSCTYCDEVCPVKIMPHLIYKHVENDIIDEILMRLEIFNCIECNLCSYICPSKIPLANSIKEGKEKLIEQGFTSSEDAEEGDANVKESSF